MPRIAVRVAAILLIAYAAHLLMDWVLDRAEHLGPSIGKNVMVGVVVLVLVAYAILIAVPFVPGIEIGLSLMMIRGADVAPYVYIATVAGLLLAFLAGRFLPYDWLSRIFADLRLYGACRMLAQIAPMSREDRLALMRASLPAWLKSVAVDLRYVMLALLIILPGNSFLGGGGGLCFVAGLSGLYGTRAAAVTIAIAVAPVPLLIWIFGFEIALWLR